MENKFLKHANVVWVNKIKDINSKNFESSILRIKEINTIIDFWEIMCYLDFDSLNEVTLYFFKNGIKPLWEDLNNRNGGKFIIRFPIELKKYYIERALIEYLLNDDNNINGITIGLKNNYIEFGYWTKELELFTNKQRIKNWLYSTLNIDKSITIEYKSHELNDNADIIEIDQGVIEKLNIN